jgi:hypothetical protein
MSTHAESVLDAELRQLDDTSLAAKANALMLAALGPPNGELRLLNDKIAEFERDRRMSSEEMRAGLAAGLLREDDFLCRWLLTMSLRDRVARRVAEKAPAR